MIALREEASLPLPIVQEYVPGREVNVGFIRDVTDQWPPFARFAIGEGVLPIVTSKSRLEAVGPVRESGRTV